jgi:hypothetical protein
MAKLKGTQIVSFQRGPTWITQSLGQTLGVPEHDDSAEIDENENGIPEVTNGDVGVDMAVVSASDEEVGSNFNPRYTNKEKRRFQSKQKHRAYRKMLQHGMNKGFRLVSHPPMLPSRSTSLTTSYQFRKDSPENHKSSRITIARMRAALNNDPQLCEKLIPNWVIGCRRLTPGEGYLESFLLPSVTLENTPISHITSTGISTTAGTHCDLDVIICATGFNVSHIPPFPVTGRDNHTLASLWKDEPESYLSVMCPHIPNYFILTGPNSTVGHGTLLTSMGWTCEYILRWVSKIAGEGIHSTAPTQRATQEFVRYGDKIHNTLTWSGKTPLPRSSEIPAPIADRMWV